VVSLNAVRLAYVRPPVEASFAYQWPEARLGMEKIAEEVMAGRQDRKRCDERRGEKFTTIETIPSDFLLGLGRWRIRMRRFGPATK
jgi:hypothetical protein